MADPIADSLPPMLCSENDEIRNYLPVLHSATFSSKHCPEAVSSVVVVDFWPLNIEVKFSILKYWFVIISNPRLCLMFIGIAEVVSKLLPACM